MGDITCKLLIIGAGPIVIGQACEFDYSGTQACKALRAEGYRIVLVNSNPATIMTDPDLADATYVEPITLEVVTRVIERERPDALLPTMGGQTALNVSFALAENGTLERYGVEMIGASRAAILHQWWDFACSESESPCCPRRSSYCSQCIRGYHRDDPLLFFSAGRDRQSKAWRRR